MGFCCFALLPPGGGAGGVKYSPRRGAGEGFNNILKLFPFPILENGGEGTGEAPEGAGGSGPKARSPKTSAKADRKKRTGGGGGPGGTMCF